MIRPLNEYVLLEKLPSEKKVGSIVLTSEKKVGNVATVIAVGEGAKDKDGKRIYVQVCYLLASEKTKQREFGAYNNIKDNYPKYVLSMDPFNLSQDGIIHQNIIDFLLSSSI